MSNVIFQTQPRPSPPLALRNIWMAPNLKINYFSMWKFSYLKIFGRQFYHHSNAVYLWYFRPGDDGNRIPDAIAPHACIKSSADYELSLILKEIRYITDQVRKIFSYFQKISHLVYGAISIIIETNIDLSSRQFNFKTKLYSKRITPSRKLSLTCIFKSMPMHVYHSVLVVHFFIVLTINFPETF